MRQIDLLKLNLEKFNLRIKEVDSNEIVISGLNKQREWKLRRFVPLELTAKTIGLWYGDGEKVRCIGITNTEIKVIKTFIKFLKILGIDVQKSYVEIVVPKNKEIPSEAEIKQILGVIPRKIKIRKLEQSRKVTWRIRIFSRILCRLFKSLFWYFQESSDKEVKLNFLKGLLAAEGCVGLRKDGFAHNIYISLKKEREREVIKKHFLDFLGVETIKDSYDSIRIGNLKNIKKFVELDLFELHPQKRSKLVSSFKRS